MVRELTESELATYSRQIVLADIFYDGQLSLRNAKACRVGVEGLDCPTALKPAGKGSIRSEASVRRPADVRQASGALRVLDRTLAGAKLLRFQDFLQNQRAAVLPHVIFDVLSRVLEAVTDELIHVFTPR
jgi:hypothetical protein